MRKFPIDPAIQTAFRDTHRIATSLTSNGVVDLLNGNSVRFETWLDISSREAVEKSLRDDGVSGMLVKHALSPGGSRYVRDNIYDLSRAGWQVLCPLRRDSVVLDFGCGLGALSRSLSRNVGHVIGVDACHERLLINAAVNRELDVRNVLCVCGNHESLAEFRDGSMDGLVLNGVLEWLPENIAGQPYQVQLEFLRECRRILKPSGWLYLGIENRWGFRYFLGKPDEHTQLLFSNLLPRWMATVYSRLVRGKPYRTYTHGPSATRKLLREAGFAETETYTPLPDYRGFTAITPIPGKPQMAGVAAHLGISKSWKKKIVESVPFQRHFVPCLSVIASKDRRVVPEWLADLYEPEQQVFKFYVKYDQASIWYRRRSGEIRVRELALSSDAASKLSHVSELSTFLKSSESCPTVLRDVTLTQCDAFTWADRTFIEGRTLVEGADDDREVFFRELRRVHNLAKRTTWVPMSLGDILDENAPNAGRDLCPRFLVEMRSVISRIEAMCDQTPILMHGDAQPANVLVGNGQAQLIDWEWARVVENVGYDVLKFAWFQSENPDGLDFQCDNAVVENSLDDSRARQYFEEVHPDGDWKSSVLVYWVNRLARTIGLFRYGGMPQDWQHRVLEPWTESIQRVSGV